LVELFVFFSQKGKGKGPKFSKKGGGGGPTKIVFWGEKKRVGEKKSKGGKKGGGGRGELSPIFNFF